MMNDDKKMYSLSKIGCGLGIFSLFITLYGVIPMAALIVSFLGLSKIDVNDKKDRNCSIVGIVTSIITMIFMF